MAGRYRHPRGVAHVQESVRFPALRSLAGEHVRRTARADAETAASLREIHGRASGARSAEEVAVARASDLRISRLPWGDGLLVGCFQILALLAGISRSGATIVGGL